MFGHLLNRLPESRESRLVVASSRRYVHWTAVAALSLVLLLAGLDTTTLNVALPLPDQLGAEGSALRWIERAEAIATWSWTATVETALVGGRPARADSGEHAVLLVDVRVRRALDPPLLVAPPRWQWARITGMTTADHISPDSSIDSSLEPGLPRV